MNIPLETALYLVGVNLASIALFAWDKYCAERDLRRIPESTLLTVAAIGGSLGAIAAQQRFRHKTRKEPFRTYLHVIIGLQVVMLMVFGVFFSVSFS